MSKQDLIITYLDEHNKALYSQLLDFCIEFKYAHKNIIKIFSSSIDLASKYPETVFFYPVKPNLEDLFFAANQIIKKIHPNKINNVLMSIAPEKIIFPLPKIEKKTEIYIDRESFYGSVEAFVYRTFLVITNIEKTSPLSASYKILNTNEL